VRVKAKALGGMTCPKHRDRISCRGRRPLHERPAIRPLELESPIRPARDLVALLVHRAVMPAAEEGQIRERRGPALCPVMEMMPLGDANAAARKAAASVAVEQRPPQGRRNGPGSGSDGHNIPRLS